MIRIILYIPFNDNYHCYNFSHTLPHHTVHTDGAKKKKVEVALMQDGSSLLDFLR